MTQDKRLAMIGFTRRARIAYSHRQDRAAEDIEFLSWAIVRLLRGDRPICREDRHRLIKINWVIYYDHQDAQTITGLLGIVVALGGRVGRASVDAGDLGDVGY